MIWLLFFLGFSIVDDALITLHHAPCFAPVIRQVEAEGGFSVRPISTGEFDAYWDGNTREVLVNLSKHDSSTSVVFSILFELHNAMSNQRLKNLQTSALEKRISKEHFIRKVEQMEWKNLNHTLELLEEGKANGALPRHIHYPKQLDFDSHLKLQIAGGHSAYIGEMYQDLFRFR